MALYTEWSDVAVGKEIFDIRLSVQVFVLCKKFKVFFPGSQGWGFVFYTIQCETMKIYSMLSESNHLHSQMFLTIPQSVTILLMVSPSYANIPK